MSMKLYFMYDADPIPSIKPLIHVTVISSTKEKLFSVGYLNVLSPSLKNY